MDDDLFEDEDELPIPSGPSEPHPNEALPIAERVELGVEQGDVRNGAIVPFPSHLRGSGILDALTGDERRVHLWRVGHGYRPTAYEARHTDGRLLQAVLRYDHAAEPKLVRPLRYCGKGNHGQDVFWFSWIPGTKPLYGADRVVARPEALVLAVEGEKTADAAAELFPDHVAITWLAGAPAARLADVFVLAGRKLVVWPDNDVAGRRAAALLAARALEAGAASVGVVDLPRDFPEKWDLADPAPDGITRDQLRHLVATARVMSAEDADALLRAPERRARARRVLGHAPGYSRVAIEDAANALNLLPADMAGSEWRQVARCWFFAFGPSGLTSFDEWSQGGGEKYRAGEPAAMWANFAKEEGFSALSLAWLLRKARRAAEEDKKNTKVDAAALVTAEIDAMNENHAVVLRGTKTAVMRETYDARFERYSVEYLKKTDLLDFHVRTVRLPGTDGKPGALRKLGKLWFDSPWRRQYEGVVFAPGGTAGSRKINLWRGFAVEAADNPQGWSRLKDHIREHVAAGDPDSYAYILDWMAAGVQRLSRPAGSALALIGSKGAGKTILTVLYGHLFGPHKFVTSISEDIVGKFNAHLEQTLLLGVEEAFAPQNRAADGTLKDLITRETLRLEDKFFSTWTARNHLRIILTSNNDHVVRADGSDRRYAVFEVQNPHQADPDERRRYFGAMVEQMENGGYEAMLGELLARDISGWNAEAIPETAALRKQKLLNLGNDPVRSWLHERLADGVYIVPGRDAMDPEHRWGENAPTVVPVRDVINNFVEYGRRNNYRCTERMLSMKLGKLLPPGFASRVEKFDTVDGGKSTRRVYDFPKLADARAAFTVATGIAAWEEAGGGE